jgi:hypothetical protein
MAIEHPGGLLVAAIECSNMLTICIGESSRANGKVQLAN